MKKLFAALSLGMLVVGSSYAQTTTPQQNQNPRSVQRDAMKNRAQKSPEEMAQKRTDKLAQKLELNASQTNQLQALNQRHAQEMKAMRESHRATGEKTAEEKAKMQEARKASHDKWQTELKGILTPQQFAKYEADKAEMKQKRGEGKKGRKGGEFKKKGDYKNKQQQGM